MAPPAEGWTFSTLDPSEKPPCAFCRQAVPPGLPTACPRCGAVYHPDCWVANTSRCAVYGCVPSPAPRRERPAAAAPSLDFSPPGPRRSVPWGVVAAVAVVLSQVARLASGPAPAERRPARESFRALASHGAVPSPADRQRESFVQVVRRFFEALDREKQLPQDPRSRDALRRWVDSAALELSRIRDHDRTRELLKEPAEGEKRGERTALIERLRQLSAALSEP